MATLTFISESIDDYNYGEWLSSSLKFQRLLLKHAAGSVNGTIKIIDFTGPINKACFQLGAVIRLILIMEKPLFLHCSPFALFSPGASHILQVGFHVGMGSVFYWTSRAKDIRVCVKVTGTGTEDAHCEIWYVPWLNKFLFFFFFKINTIAINFISTIQILWILKFCQKEGFLHVITT